MQKKIIPTLIQYIHNCMLKKYICIVCIYHIWYIINKNPLRYPSYSCLKYWNICRTDVNLNVLDTNTDIIELSILILSNFHTSAISIWLLLFITYLLIHYTASISLEFVPVFLCCPYLRISKKIMENIY